MIWRVAIGALLVLVAACATPAQRITARLAEYGVPAAPARCMGDRLQSRLSIGQLQRLDEIGKTLGRDRIGRLSLRDISRALDRPADAQLVSELLRASVSCLI